MLWSNSSIDATRACSWLGLDFMLLVVKIKLGVA